MAEEVRANLIIHGRVQGVFFRASTRDMAVPLGLKGFVRNLPLMRVEAEFQGPREAVEKAIEWCHQGPPSALVRKVEVRWLPPTDEYHDFSIRY
jgi:acylphosphatase